jgi:hypothetical protein
LRALTSDPTLREIGRDWLHLQHSYPKPKKQNKSRSISYAHTSLDLLRRLLPDQDTCRASIDLYLRTFQSIFLDVTYLQAVKDMLHGANDLACSDEDLPVLLGIVAVGTAIPMQGADQEQSDREKSADELTSSLEQWLDSLMGKRRLHLGVLETRLLCVLATAIRGQSPDYIWENFGSIVRLATRMGLHDNSSMANISALDCERQSKLWRLIIEYDLQVSLDSSMPWSPPFWGLSNEAISTAIGMITPENVLQKTFSLRGNIWARINGSKYVSPIKDEEAVKMLGEYASTLAAPWKPFENVREAHVLHLSRYEIFRQMITYIFLARPLAYLCRELAFNRQSNVELTLRCREALVETSASILTAIHVLDLHDQGIQDGKSVLCGELFYKLFLNDIFRAMIYISLDIKKPVDETSSGVPLDAVDPMSTALKSDILERGLDSVLCRVRGAGKDLKAYVCLSMIRSSALGHGSTTNENAAAAGAHKALLVAKEHLAALRGICDTSTSQVASSVINTSSQANSVGLTASSESGDHGLVSAEFDWDHFRLNAGDFDPENWFIHF